ncbi:MAG: O-antigen ligase family protein [Solirubrobacterales bacterium]|nr:O-antigen ligase family protein [Solirubrobacterales bacterium]
MGSTLALIDPIATVGVDLQKAGVILAALLAGAALLAPAPRIRALAMALALLLTPALLVTELWNTSQLQPVRNHTALAAAGAVIVLVLLVGSALLILRRPLVFPIAAIAVLPFRVPIESAGQTANLLVPLYFVIAAGALAFVIDRVIGKQELNRPKPGALEWLLALSVLAYAAQASYSGDFSKALQQLVFFYIPFIVLFALLVQVQWTVRLALICLSVLVALGLAFTAIGIVEYRTRTLLLNPKVISSNQLESYFRVNSLFFDPNIFGRFLMVVMLGVAAVMVWARQRRVVIGCVLVLAVLWIGVVLSLSQSTLSALLIGLLVLGGLRWSVKVATAAAALAVAIGLAIVLITPGAIGIKDASLDRATSGRADLVDGGIRLMRERPIAGWGSGAFSVEYKRAESATSAQTVSASHTIPITIGAEQGAIGLAIYLALLAAAFWRLLRGASLSPLRAAVAAMFAALVFQTLLYAAFLEDPITWALLAIGSAAAAATTRKPRDPVSAGDPTAAALPDH